MVYIKEIIMKRIRIIPIIAITILMISCNKRSHYPCEADYSSVDTIY